MQCDSVTYRLEELATHSQWVAEQLQLAGENQRVQWSLSPRLLRYYTTLGLLDRASFMRGRTAFYGVRHLLQVLAVKKLQVLGVPLSGIQERLLGATNSQLHGILGLPADWTPAPSDRNLDHNQNGEPYQQTQPSPTSKKTVRRFWEENPPEPQPQESSAAVPQVEPLGQSSLWVDLATPAGLRLQIEQQLLSKCDQAQLLQWLSECPLPQIVKEEP